ncbi:hypothetical protein AOQ88_01330 [Candidatus Riesia sp. GBBU]|nr:hypothetical protein AOQ88_01330 [Candidatus Riesia sp. GBBU]
MISLLNRVNFNPNNDSLWITGDISFKGPNTIDVIRYIRSLGKAAKMVLGNHDLSLINDYFKFLKNRKIESKTKELFTKNKDIKVLVNWLKSQPFVRINEHKKLIMVHAGILPKWNKNFIIKYSKIIQTKLVNEKISFLERLLDINYVDKISKKLSKIQKLQFIINVFTKIRFCTYEGKLDLFYNGTEKKTDNTKPWFEFKRRKLKSYSIIFGHWSTLDKVFVRDNMYCLDTGCCWGKKLTIFHWEDKKTFSQKSFTKDKC